MLRNLTWFAGSLLLALAAGQLMAQEAWPPVTTMGTHTINRGPGFYLALYKIFLLLVPFWLWVKSADWVSRDAVEMGDAIGMPARVWNPVMVFTFLLAIVVVAMEIPLFIVGYLVVLLAYFVPFTIYVVMRNKKVTEDKRVFTPSHIKNWLSNIGKRGPKKEVEVKHPWQLGPPLEISAVGPLQMENQAAIIDARQSPAFVPVKYLLADALVQRADKIMLEYTADAVAVRYQIDGVWHNAAPKVIEKPKKEEGGPPIDRQLGDMMLAALKRIAHLNMAERRARQEGKMRVDFNGNKHETVLLSQGTPTGERAVLSFTLVTKTVPTLEDLGMRDKHRDQLKEIIGPGATGIVLFSTLPGDGLTRMWVAALRGTDRLMRDFISIEDEKRREPDVENVDVQKIKVAEGETPEKVLPSLILKQPEVICIPEVASGKAIDILAKWIEDETKLSLMSIRAKDAPDALLRTLALQPGEKFPQQIKAVVYERLVRKLCETCREAVQPTPDLLQKLGIPAGRVQVLYREKQPPPPGQEQPRKKGEPLICPACNGLGYRGRTGVFELLVIDDKMRQALAAQPKLEVIKQLARQSGNRSLQEEGILLVALGTTSLAELQRALKQ